MRSARRRHRARRRRRRPRRAIAQKQVFVHDDPDLVAGFPRRVDGASSRAARVRGPRRPARRRADRRDRRRHRPRVRRARSRHHGLAGADDRRAVVARPIRRTARPSASTSPGGAITIGAPDRRRSRRRRPERSRRQRHRRQRLGVAGERAAPSGFTPTEVDGRVQFGHARRPAFSRDDTVDPGSVQPDEARLRRARRRRPTSTATASSRSSRPRSTGTCTPGTTTARRSPASRCSRSTRPRSRRSTRVAPRHVHRRLGRPRGRRAHRHADPRRPHRRRPPGDRRSARRRSTRRRRTSATARRCSRCSAASADLGNSRLYAISPDGRNATNPDRSPAHPDDQAYVPGWPVALGQLGLEVLPTIGDGVAMQVAAGDVHPHPGYRDRRGVRRGPAVRARRDRPLRLRRGRRPARCPRRGPAASSAKARRGSVRSATPTTSSLSDPGVLRLRARRRSTATTQPGVRGADDGLHATARHPGPRSAAARTTTSSAVGRASTGDLLPGFPQVTSDMAFFVTPAIADLDGDGTNEVDRRQRPVHARGPRPRR